MQTLAAVLTGSGTSAIATIEVFGPEACNIVSHLFTPYGTSPPRFDVGSILVGHLHDNHKPIDQITVGCEGEHHLALHCHGNPLIVETAMTLLKAQGVQLVKPEDIRTRQLATSNLSLCQQETHLALVHCRTLLGARLLNHQIQESLTAWAQKKHNSVEALHSQCKIILDQSLTAHQILNGITVALIGPPNSGKSTLLNSLSGQDAAIVTDIKGTTRDWVEANCHTDNLAMRLIDTAGLDSMLQQNRLDTESQDRTLSVIRGAHILLLVLDNAQSATQIESHWFDRLPKVPRLTLLNKSDLPNQLNLKDLGLNPATAISISAKNETGLNNLLTRIEQTLQVKNFDITQPLCVTPRQRQCLEEVLLTQTLAQAQKHLKVLVNGN